MLELETVEIKLKFENLFLMCFMAMRTYKFRDALSFAENNSKIKRKWLIVFR